MLSLYRCLQITDALHEEFDRRMKNLNFSNKFSSTVILTGLVLGLSCGIAGCKTRSNRAWLRDSGGCSGKLSSDQEVGLVNAINELNAAFLRGEISRDERDAQTGTAINATASGDAAALRQATGVAALAAESLYGNYSMIAALDFLELDGEIPKSALPLLSSSIPPEYLAAYLADLSETILPYRDSLQAAGAVYQFGQGWDLSGMRLSVQGLQGDSKLLNAIGLLLAPQAAADLANQERRESVVASPWVFLPPRADGQIQVSEMADWQKQVTESLRRFEAESQNFILSVRESNTYWNLMSGRLGEVFTGRRQDTPAEINAAGSYKRMLMLVDGLGQKGVGVSKGMTSSLLAFMHELNNIEAKSIESGLAKADAARRAALAAPFVPLTMYFAPFLAYAVNPAAIPTIQAASASAALVPLTFGIGSAILHSAVVSLATGQPLACGMYEELVSRGSDAVYQAPYMAMLPVASVVGGEILLGWKLATPTVETVKGTINVAIGLKMAYLTASAGYRGGKECYEAFKALQASGATGDQNLVSERGNRAVDICTQAGIDLGIAMVRTGYIAKDGYQLLTKQIKFQPPVPQCDAQSCNALPLGPGAAKLATDNKNNSKALQDQQNPARLNISNEEAEALGKYGTYGYARINGAMRFGGEIPPATAAQIQAINSAIAKAPALPVDMALIRGETLGRGNFVPEVGQSIKFNYFVSTSIDPDVAKSFTSKGFFGKTGIVYEIRPPAGQSLKGLYMPGMPKTMYRHEQEVLLAPNQNFQVVDLKSYSINRGSASNPDKVFYVTLEAAP